MLITIGRGLAPMANKTLAPVKKFHFIDSLPGEITFSRNSVATITNAQGKLVEVSANQPRLGHTASGTPLGLLIEPSATNKCENYNTNPADTTGFTTSGTGTLSVVDDTTELANAKLDAICTSGKVFKAEATTGSAFTVYIPGTVSNTNAHSMQLYARGEGSGSRTAQMSLEGTALDIAPAGDEYGDYQLENITPGDSSKKITLSVDGNDTLYFILYQLEENEYCTSIIPTSGSSVTRSTDRAYAPNIDQHNWFDINQGYIICRYIQNHLLDSYAYIATLDDGSSSNTIGLRIDKTLHNPRPYVRFGSSSQFTTGNLDYQLPNTLNAAGIRWKSNDADIMSGGKITHDSSVLLPVGINNLDIGARNGGSDPMDGYIQYIEIGTRDLTTIQLGNRLQHAKDMAIIGAGQSLIRGYFKSQASDSEEGKQKHREIIGQAQKDKAVLFIDGTTGGSAASKTSNATDYWWDLATSSRGPSLDTFYSAINNVGAGPTIILWGQGEEDSHSIGIETSAAQYKQCLEAIFADIRTTLGDVSIYIQRIGRRSSFTNTGGVQAVRDIQKELIDENIWCFEAAEIYDLDLFDQVHLTDSGYITAAERNSLALLNASGKTGISITTAIRSGTSVTVTISHDAGTDFTPTSGIEGFKFFDDATEIAISSAVRTNSTTITLTLASTPTGVETLYYGYDDMAGITTANVVTDNASLPMPLRTAKIGIS